ncbi:hypothetical protein B0T26DRAFT_757514 [Lasiosphaeria miniovina]|uniref:Uncharacterized protein n=1 Tax=Lasiosphaeria miniovina TaxID=1954250 RepID=A0AA39ZV06_9PEZI|nr:uncharacterized protein B0T26DRAFT_757514 [Lasiosphaeria miniovina]KAK0704020.1 hypothetical protein B0T26DRAFT_757514 [Lasiosphaeria miniovina]
MSDEKSGHSGHDHTCDHPPPYESVLQDGKSPQQNPEQSGQAVNGHGNPIHRHSTWCTIKQRWRKLWRGVSGPRPRPSSRQPVLPDTVPKPKASQQTKVDKAIQAKPTWLGYKSLTDPLPNGPVKTKPVKPRFKYLIESFHLPVENQSKNTYKAAPWGIHFSLQSHKLETLLPGDIAWRENLKYCYEDCLKLRRDDNSRKNAYIRQLDLEHVAALRSDSWSVTISVYSYGSSVEWLMSLSYVDIAALISTDTAVRCFGKMEVSKDPLQDRAFFYYKYLKEWRCGCMKKGPGAAGRSRSTLGGIDKFLDIDKPELRELMEKHFEKHIQIPLA